MSGTQPPPRFHIDEIANVPNDVEEADFGRVFEPASWQVGTCSGRVLYQLVKEREWLLTFQREGGGWVREASEIQTWPPTLIALDDPHLYPAIGVAIQRTSMGKFDAIRQVRQAFGLSLAQAKALVEAVLAEGSERGPITSAGLVGGRLAVEREVDAQRAQDMDDRPETARRIDPRNRGPVPSSDWPSRRHIIKSVEAPRQRRAEEFGDAFDALEQVLSNLGLGEQYQSTLLANLDKHQPEILSAIGTIKHEVATANERASAATAEAARLSSRLKDALDDGAAIAAAAREANATIGRVMHALRGVVAFPDVQHVVDPELPSNVREALADLCDLIARQRVQPPHPDWTLRQGLWTRLYPDGTTALVFSDHQWTRGLGGPDPVRGIAKSQREAMVDADAAA